MLSKDSIMVQLSSPDPTLIIDLQGFQYKDSEFIVKELAVVCCNTKQQAHYLFKPPYPFSSLPHDKKTQYRWLERNHHGLKWSQGYIQLTELPLILQRFCQNAVNNHQRQHSLPLEDVIILCKGRIKKNFLQQFLRWNKIIDLDDFLLCLPSLKSLNIPKCVEHSRFNNCHCALANVYFLHKCIVDLNIRFE